VQKFGRVAFILVGGLLILAVVLLLGVNLYVQSQGTQARIEHELSQRLGTPLTFQRISVTPWSGIQLSGISVTQGPAAGAADWLQVESFGLRLGFFSVFSRHLVIKDISLTEPRVVWPQDPDGKWRLPNLRKVKEKNGAAVASAAENRSANESSVETQTAPVKEAATAPEPAPSIISEQESSSLFVPEVHGVSFSGGVFRFLDRSGKLVASFDDVKFRASLRNASELQGSGRAMKVSLRDRFFLDQLKSQVEYGPAGLELTRLSARAADGSINGKFSLQTETKNSPFNVDVKFRNVQADRIIIDAGGQAGIVQGKLEGSLQANGMTADPNAINGTGEIFLRDGQVKQYSLLVALGQMLQIDELTQLHLEQAQAKYHIEPGVITVDELILRSPNIRLSATGTITFAGKLHLDSQLAIDEKIRAQLFKPIRANFQPTDEAGYSAVAFEVNGTVEHPKTNLLEKVVGHDLKDLVNSFWGGKESHPKKKKQAEPNAESSVSPSPSIADQLENTATPAPSP
jgi:type II secretion system protein N